MADSTIGAKVKELREAKGWSQEELGRRAGVVQMTVSRLERGIMKRPSFDTLAGLATALGVDMEALRGGQAQASESDAVDPSALAEARLIAPNIPQSTWDLIARMRSRGASQIPPALLVETARSMGAPHGSRLGEPRGLVYGADPRPPEEDETPLESALFAVMDSKKYRAPVFDAARRVIRETYRFTREDADLEAQARSYLEAAARLHREGKPMTTAAVLAYVINGSLPGAAEVSKERAAALTEQADAELRAKGMEPGQGSDRLKAAVARRAGKGG